MRRIVLILIIMSLIPNIIKANAQQLQGDDEIVFVKVLAISDREEMKKSYIMARASEDKLTIPPDVFLNAREVALIIEPSSPLIPLRPSDANLLAYEAFLNGLIIRGDFRALRKVEVVMERKPALPHISIIALDGQKSARLTLDPGSKSELKLVGSIHGESVIGAFVNITMIPYCDTISFTAPYKLKVVEDLKEIIYIPGIGDVECRSLKFFVLGNLTCVENLSRESVSFLISYRPLVVVNGPELIGCSLSGGELVIRVYKRPYGDSWIVVDEPPLVDLHPAFPANASSDLNMMGLLYLTAECDVWMFPIERPSTFVFEVKPLEIPLKLYDLEGELLKVPALILMNTPTGDKLEHDLAGIGTLRFSTLSGTIHVEVFLYGILTQRLTLFGFPKGELKLKCNVRDLKLLIEDNAGTPIARARISIYSHGGVLLLSSTTDHEGAVEFEDLPLGPYVVSVMFGAAEIKEALLLDAGTPAQLKLKLGVVYVRLKVVDELGNPIYNATVYVMRKGGKAIELYSGSDGTVEVGYVNHYSLSYAVELYGVEVSRGDFKASPTVTIKCRARPIDIKTTDLFGLPLEGVFVRIMVGEHVVMESRTSPSGVLSSPPLPTKGRVKIYMNYAGNEKLITLDNGSEVSVRFPVISFMGHLFGSGLLFLCLIILALTVLILIVIGRDRDEVVIE